MAQPKLLEQYRERLRVKHYSLRTEDAYLHWARRFICFHGKRHPREMGGPEVEAFLSHLATEDRVAASTQNQALAALLFLYREVLEKELPWMEGMVRAKRPARVPVALTQTEVRALLGQLDGTRWLATSLLYATGMRLLEGLRLRVKDVDFERREITVRDGKGGRDRRTMLPERLIEPLRSHLERVKVLCTSATSPRASGTCTCHSRWRASTRVRAAAGPGSTYFPPADARPIRSTASFAAITWTTRSCSAPYRRPHGRLVSRNPCRRISCGTVSPRICWRAAMTSAPSRSFSATRMSRPR